ncbi:hypothetical protein J6590_025056 [Homalodisca vitripennis]|nr:hypothetical protein J6590_025056 [Homalodisca vitripennis]
MRSRIAPVLSFVIYALLVCEAKIFTCKIWRSKLKDTSYTSYKKRAPYDLVGTVFTELQGTTEDPSATHHRPVGLSAVATSGETLTSASRQPVSSQHRAAQVRGVEARHLGSRRGHDHAKKTTEEFAEERSTKKTCSFSAEQACKDFTAIETQKSQKDQNPLKVHVGEDFTVIETEVRRRGKKTKVHSKPLKHRSVKKRQKDSSNKLDDNTEDARVDARESLVTVHLTISAIFWHITRRPPIWLTDIEIGTAVGKLVSGRSLINEEALQSEFMPRVVVVVGGGVATPPPSDARKADICFVCHSAVIIKKIYGLARGSMDSLIADIVINLYSVPSRSL